MLYLRILPESGDALLIWPDGGAIRIRPDGSTVPSSPAQAGPFVKFGHL